MNFGTDDKKLEAVLDALDSEKERAEFRKLVIDDPRAARYKGASRIEDILTQELSGRNLGRATAMLQVLDGKSLLMAALNTPTYQNLLRACGSEEVAQLVFSNSVDSIKKSSLPKCIKDMGMDLAKSVEDLGRQAHESKIFDSSPPSLLFLEEDFSVADLLLFKNIYTQVSYQIEEMQNLAAQMQNVRHSAKSAPMERFKKARTELDSTLYHIQFERAIDHDVAMQHLKQATAEMLREAIIFKVQEGYGLSQYEQTARSGELAMYSVVGASATIVTMGAAAQVMGAGAAGLAGLGLSKGALAGTAGVMVGASVQTATHISTIKYMGSEGMEISEIAKGAFREQFMTAAGLMTGAQLGRVFMSAEKFQHLKTLLPRVAGALEGAVSNVAIGGEYMATGQVEFDPKIIGLWAVSGMLSRGVLSGLDDALEDSAKAILIRRLGAAAGTLAKDISMEASEEILETLISQGYITPDQVVQCATAALQEMGSGEAVSKVAKTTIQDFAAELTNNPESPGEDPKKNDAEILPSITEPKFKDFYDWAEWKKKDYYSGGGGMPWGPDGKKLIQGAFSYAGFPPGGIGAPAPKKMVVNYIPAWPNSYEMVGMPNNFPNIRFSDETFKNTEVKKPYNKATALKLIEEGQAEAVAKRLGHYEGLDKEVAHLLIERRLGNYIVKYSDCFTGLDEETVSKLIESGSVDYSDYNVRKLLKLSEIELTHKAVAIKLIKSGQAKIVAKNICDFKGLDKEIAEMLIDNGEGKTVAINFDKFVGLDQEIIFKLFASGCFSGVVLSELSKIYGLEHKALAKKLIEDGYVKSVADYISSFEGVDKEIAHLLIEHGHVEQVVNYITSFADLDQEIAEMLIEKGYANYVAAGLSELRPVNWRVELMS